MIICDNCEEAKAVRYNDGDRVCQACSTIIDEMRVTNPELYEKGECITCGAERCEDALCREERKAAHDYQLDERDEEDENDTAAREEWEDDRTTFDMSDDAEALASAGWGTDEDYGYYGGED